jgi:hypothetical protein
MHERPPHRNDWAIKSLRSAIDRDGRGVKRYAREVLVRPPTTIYRWLAGHRPIPRCVREFLVGDFRILASPISKDTTTGEEKHEQEE